MALVQHSVSSAPRPSLRPVSSASEHRPALAWSLFQPVGALPALRPLGEGLHPLRGRKDSAPSSPCAHLGLEKGSDSARRPLRGQGSGPAAHRRRHHGGGRGQRGFPSGGADSQAVLSPQHTANAKFAGTYWPKELGV